MMQQHTAPETETHNPETDGRVAERVAQLWHALARAHHHGWASHTDWFGFASEAEKRGLDAAVAMINRVLDASEKKLREEHGCAMECSACFLGLRPERAHKTASHRVQWLVRDDGLKLELHRPRGRCFTVFVTVAPREGGGEPHVAVGCEGGPEPMAERHLQCLIEIVGRWVGLVPALKCADVIAQALDHTTE